VSGRIRLERERCCDEAAVRVCGDRVVYAQALEANASNETALIVAASRGHRDAVAFLLDNKASIDTPDADNGTALIVAASNGHLEVARTLLARGANVNAQMKSSEYTALHIAAVRFDVELMKLLLDRGAGHQQEGAPESGYRVDG
jgi:ankyrin repeat protein